MKGVFGMSVGGSLLKKTTAAGITTPTNIIVDIAITPVILRRYSQISGM